MRVIVVLEGGGGGVWGPVTSGGTAPAWTRPCTLAANRQQQHTSRECLKNFDNLAALLHDFGDKFNC